MTMVSELFAAINRSDLDRVARMYAADCVVELVFADDAPLQSGRAAVTLAWAREHERYAGALPGGRRYDVSRVAGIETGWGWVRADFVRGLRHAVTGTETIDRGYSYFWIEDGAIRRQRTILGAPARNAEAVTTAA